VRRTLPLAIGLLVVLALAAVSTLLGRLNLHEAEQERLAERARLTQSIGSYVTQAYAPAKLQADVDRAPFNASSPALNELLLQQFQVTPTGDPNVIVALFDRSGRSIAARPEKNSLTISTLGDAWPRALSGSVAQTQAFRLDGDVFRAIAVPVGKGTPWAVLVTVPRDDSGRQFQQRLEGFGAKGGGYSTVDGSGIVLTSHDPAQIGSRQFDAAQMQAIRSEHFHQWFTGTGSDRTVSMTSLDPNTGYAQVFTQRLDALFSDLRHSQQVHDLTVLAVLAIAVLALVLLGWRRERAARRSAARLHALLRNSHDLLLVVNPDFTTRFVSPAVEVLLGHDAADLTGRPLLDVVHPGDADRVVAMLTDQLDSKLLNVRLRAADGTVRWFDIESSDRSAVVQLSGILLTCHEVGDRKNLQDRLTHQASHDELTGLANRAVFVEQVELARTRIERDPAGRFALLFIDLDHFKPVNDTLGHDAGDQVLRTVAARLSGTVRPADLVCRFGGDEFGVLLDGADQETACEIASRLVAAVRATVAVGTKLVNIDASIGITLAEDGSATPEMLIRQADEAMYLAKESGRGRYAVHADRYRDPHARGRGPGGALPLPRSSQPESNGVVQTRPAGSLAHRGFPRHVPTADRGGWRTRTRHLLPLLIAGTMVAGIAGAGSLQESRAGAAAEQHRIAERSDITVRVAEYSAVTTDPRRLMGAVSKAPWNLADRTANGAVLESFSHSPAAGSGSIVALSDLSGRVEASFPAGSAVDLPRTDETWARARLGVPGFSKVQSATTTPRAWYVLPIVRDGAPQALLLLGQDARQAEIAKLMLAVGSLGFGDGGLSGVDVNGVVLVSWDPKLTGSSLVEPRDLVGLELGQVRRFTRHGDTYLVTAAWSPGDPNKRYIVFRQPTDVFFGDLRSGQTTRNLLLLGLVCASVFGLALINRRRELSERNARERLRALLHNAHDLVVAVDAAGRTTFVSSAIEGLLGHDPAAWADRPVLELVDEADRARLHRALGPELASAGGGSQVVPDVRLRTIDGSTRWFDVGIADLTDNPALSGVLLTCHEIGERKRLQDELSHRARHDVLTGLPNRASFASHLTTLIDGAHPFAVLFIDLDHFKPINDRHGHDAGDAVLQAVASRLDAAVRSSGFRPHDLISRLGGDEFAVVLDGVDGMQARQVADRILSGIRAPIRVGTTDVAIGATIGIAFADPGAGLNGSRADLVVQRADTAMYEAKVAGRGRYAVYDGV
jgi:diguanylate cyclase (GGDEF)-like protein/PAS domain S-box-containing protein